MGFRVSGLSHVFFSFGLALAARREDHDPWCPPNDQEGVGTLPGLFLSPDPLSTENPCLPFSQPLVQGNPLACRYPPR